MQDAATGKRFAYGRVTRVIEGGIRMKRWKEAAFHAICVAAACTSIIAVGLICVFVFSNAFPAIAEIGAFEFVLGKEWRPMQGLFGILPMIVASLYVTAGAIIVGVPLGLLGAVYLARFCPKRLYGFFRPAVELLAGIPSVVYGFFGLIVLVPLTRDLFGGTGLSMFTACILLGIMILPTIITVSEAAIRAVPQNYYEGAVALGATHERAVFRILLPAAKSGLFAAVVLGMGRAIGETMAVIMVAGNQPRMPAGLFRGLRTMTANIVMEMGYAADLHRGALIATAAVLFVFILIINLLFSIMKRKERKA
jgi:phosphate transport system permease protein